MRKMEMVLFNSIRQRYLVADRDLVEQMASLHWALSMGTNGLLQQWVAEPIDSGSYAR